MSSLQLLQTAFEQLNDGSDFANYATSISDGLTSSGTDSFRAITTDSSVVGRHEIRVTSLATPDRWVSGGFAATTTELNDGDSFSVSIDFDAAGRETAVISVADPSREGLVDAINATTYGVSASLVDTGDASSPYKVVLTGNLGADGKFTVSTDIASGTSISFDSQLSSAGDANLVLDGVAVTRSSNMW